MEVVEVPTSVPSSTTPTRKRRARRSSVSSNSLSPAKENKTNRRKRTKSERCEGGEGGNDGLNSHQVGNVKNQTLTFWGWSPKKAKFKPKVMDHKGELADHPDPASLTLKSKWQPIVSVKLDHFFLHNLRSRMKQSTAKMSPNSSHDLNVQKIHSLQIVHSYYGVSVQPRYFYGQLLFSGDLNNFHSWSLNNFHS